MRNRGTEGQEVTDEIRQKVVKTLKALGLTAAMISQSTGFNLPVVLKDIRALNSEGQLEKARSFKTVFQEIFWYYMMRYQEINSKLNLTDEQLSDEERIIKAALESYLSWEKFSNVMLGLSLARDRLIRPDVSSSLQPYAKFLESVFLPDDEQAHPELSAKRYLCGCVFNGERYEGYLAKVKSGQIPVPESFEQFVKDFSQRFLRDVRFQVVPPWEDYIASVVEKVLSQIEEPDRTIIKSYYGLGVQRRTYCQLADIVHMSFTNVAARLKIIQQKIRQDAETFRPLHIIWGRIDLIKGALSKEVPFEELSPVNELPVNESGQEDDLDDEARFIEKLLVSISELGVSNRVLHALNHAGILLVGELVTKTEEQVLKIRGIRLVGLEGIKTSLQKMNLRLGMKLSFEIRQLIARKKRTAA